jgi:BirA family biotin operon repressor/biotin-[acetyl-CoA-carboxylase] ligase
LNDFEIQRQFELNQMISLAVLKVLKEYLPHVQIKWPNDIMADNRKIAGILIENTLQGKYISHSIVGIGLNVNQMEFDPLLPHAVSMKKITGIEYDLELILNKLIQSIQLKLKDLSSQINSIKKEYHENLMGWQSYQTYSTLEGNVLKAKITGISPEGKLIVETTEKQTLEFSFQEVKMVL